MIRVELAFAASAVSGVQSGKKSRAPVAEYVCVVQVRNRQDSAATARVCPLVATVGSADVVGIEST